jgi:hypothetical protein
VSIRPVSELAEIAYRGESIEVNACEYATKDLVNLAARLQPGAYLKLCNSVAKDSWELAEIASATPERIIVM